MATAIRTRSFDLCVAFSGSCMCTHEHWSRMLAISKRYGLSPASAIVLRKSGLVGSRGAGGHDYAIQIVFGNLLLDPILRIVGAGIKIVLSVHNVG